MKTGGGLARASLLGMSLLFGASFVGTKAALKELSPFELIFLRFALASVFYLLLSPWCGRGRIDGRGKARIFLLTLLEPGAYFILEAYGIQRTLASTAAVLICTIPVYVLVLEALWMKVPVVPREVLLILVSLGGIVLLVAGGGGRLGWGSLGGNLLVLAAAFTASLYTVMARKVLRDFDVLSVSRLQAIYAALLYLPLASRDVAAGGLPALSRETWGAVLYLGIGCSFLAYLLLNTALSRLKASHVAGFANVIPVVAAALAWFFLGERLGYLQGAGAVVVVAAVVFLTRGRPELHEPAVG